MIFDAPEKFEAQSKRGTLFHRVLKCHYPWSTEPVDAVTGGQAANVLYEHYRNPLTHALGLAEDPESDDAAAAKIRLSAAQVAQLEVSGPRPAQLQATLRHIDGRYALDISALYWGVRQMLESTFRDQVIMTSTEALLKKLFDASARHARIRSG